MIDKVPLSQVLNDLALSGISLTLPSVQHPELQALRHELNDPWLLEAGLPKHIGAQYINPRPENYTPFGDKFTMRPGSATIIQNAKGSTAGELTHELGHGFQNLLTKNPKNIKGDTNILSTLTPKQTEIVRSDIKDRLNPSDPMRTHIEDLHELEAEAFNHMMNDKSFRPGPLLERYKDFSEYINPKILKHLPKFGGLAAALTALDSNEAKASEGSQPMERKPTGVEAFDAPIRAFTDVLPDAYGDYVTKTSPGELAMDIRDLAAMDEVALLNMHKAMGGTSLFGDVIDDLVELGKPIAPYIRLLAANPAVSIPVGGVAGLLAAITPSETSAAEPRYYNEPGTVPLAEYTGPGYKEQRLREMMPAYMHAELEDVKPIVQEKGPLQMILDYAQGNAAKKAQAQYE